VESGTSVLYFPRHHSSAFVETGFSSFPAYLLGRAYPTARLPYPPASPHHSNDAWWYRNINLFSIAYAFRPRLRSRLTLRGRAFLRKPWAFGGRDSHPSFATHTGILTSKRSTSPYGLASTPLERSPTTDILRCPSTASVIRLAPVHFRRRVTRPVSYYALFK
jgi:hypothetical protein